MRKFVSVLILSVLLVGCGTAASGGWTRSEMYFGLLRLDGAVVTEAEWQSFVEQVVTPRFPAGLTIFDSAGQWRTASGHVAREPSKVLVVLHPTSGSIEAQLDEIRRIYCQRFNQEAVMKVTSAARVTF